MYILEDGDNFRRVGFIAPNFRLADDVIELSLFRKNQSQVGASSQYVDIPKQKSVKYKTLYLTDETKINPTTLAVDMINGVPAYSFIISSTPSRIGMTALNQPLYTYIANQVETYAITNNLHIEDD